MARGSHKGFAMQNHITDLASIPLDSLDGVTGGYLDHDPPSPTVLGSIGRAVTSGLRAIAAHSPPTSAAQGTWRANLSPGK
jgi:hypothetical protein